jgi:hypothetical protein
MEPKERIVKMSFKGEVKIPCKYAHQVREILEEKSEKNTVWSYTIEDIEW